MVFLVRDDLLYITSATCGLIISLIQNTLESDEYKLWPAGPCNFQNFVLTIERFFQIFALTLGKIVSEVFQA